MATKPVESVVPEFRTAYSPPLEVALFTPKDAVGAKQSFKDECNINNIVKRYSLTGEFTHLALSTPQFGDVTGLRFQEMMDYLNEAEAAFADLPAEVRRRFGNDPREFVEFASDRANVDELLKMGLAVHDKAVVPLTEPKGEGPPHLGSSVPSGDSGKPEVVPDKVAAK